MSTKLGKPRQTWVQFADCRYKFHCIKPFYSRLPKYVSPYWDMIKSCIMQHDSREYSHIQHLVQVSDDAIID